MFFDDLLRLLDLVASSLSFGALGWAIVLSVNAQRRKLRADISYLIVVLFGGGYTLLLLSGSVAEVIRIGEPIGPFTPFHLLGATLTLWALILIIRRDLRAFLGPK